MAEGKRGRGRPPGFKMPESHRSKIKCSQILNALSEHADGKREMSATQIRAAEILLRKALPDLSSVEMSGEGGGALVVNIVQDDGSHDPE